MAHLAALVAGLLFGVGLVISGMANPAKVLNFLDITGTWDPSLAFVMGGGIAVGLPGLALVTKRAHPLFAERFSLPQKSDIDKQLLLGAATFGIGWGLIGFCPGPAITAVPLAAFATFVFVPAMLIGMWVAKQMK